MEQPPRFVAQWEIGKTCRLRKSLYGLKQVLVLDLANSVRQLRHLACRRVSLTTQSSIKIPILVLFYW